MKKYLLTLAAVLCCAMTTTVFTACGSDDDDNGDNTPKKPEVLGIGAVYNIAVTKQMTDYCDYTMTYYGEDNKLITESPVKWTIKDATAVWEKQVTNLTIPSTFGVRLTAKIKEGAQLDSVNITNVCPVSNYAYVTCLSKDRQTIWAQTVSFTPGNSHSIPSKGSKLQAYLEAFVEERGGLLNLSYTFDKDGKSTTGAIK
ncbi:MAG: hypothetical protein J5545_05710 [Bacteroidaceae bacterium]|nr:hypothetical protein [Bacteroidaceae bacterium]